jgi:hypothetical protein
MENFDDGFSLSPRLKQALDRLSIIGQEKRTILESIGPQLKRLEEIEKELAEINRIGREEMSDDDYSHK